MRTRTSHFLLWLLALVFFAGNAQAQTKMSEDKSKRPSPPATVTGGTGATAFTIEYSRPSAKGRTVFGGLVPYGKVWRTGANEATTFEVKQAVKINGQALPAGKYALFTIPTEQEWTIVFNKTAAQWGSFKYDQAQDALRVTVKPTKASTPVEQFTITSDKAGTVTMAWENAQASFKVTK
ncbi:DUF2911 domain-containing protein [Hymenobacter mucosus]|uniref:DUF2911 domain-containing protein n=1 Tax=Hymenobacter mucosus TaxID=1411120 RepID=A0A238V5Y5_9BACT|nr:DUF2911 domain-containing protein [Hymenobacter mucosus]SNR29447.1 Protein of unknown function [Hymenobacter mucosus]